MVVTYRRRIILLILWFLTVTPSVYSATITVGPSGDDGYTETSEKSIQIAIKALKYNGGKIVLTPGTYKISRPIYFQKTKYNQSISIVGGKGVKLIFDVAPHSTIKFDTAIGATQIILEDNAGFYGEVVGFFDKDGKPLKCSTRVAAVKPGGLIRLKYPLKQNLPAGTHVMILSNLFSLSGGVENITLYGLEIDMQRDKQPFRVRNHGRHSAIFVYAKWGYDGVKKFSRNIRIENCTIRNVSQRGIAFYAAQDCIVKNCLIENTGGEAIDIDHFCRRIKITNNILRNGDLTGIEINNGSDCIVTNNRIDGYPIGIYVWHYQRCKMKEANRRNVIIGNVIRNSGKHAILFGIEVNENTISGNIIDVVKTSSAISVLGNNNLIVGNQIWNALKGELSVKGKENILKGKPLFRFGLVADIQYADKNTKSGRNYREALGYFKQCVVDFNNQELAFVLDLGDIIDMGNWRDFDRVMGLYKKLKPKSYFVPGNRGFSLTKDHILKDKKHQGTYYDFSHMGWRFIVLDGMDVSKYQPKGSENYRQAIAYLRKTPDAKTFKGAIGEKQKAWLKERLILARKNKEKVIILCHHPTIEAASNKEAYTLWNGKEIVNILESSKNVVAYFCGHDHKGGYVERKGIHYVTCESMVEAPAGSNGYGVVEVYDDMLLIIGVGTFSSRVMRFSVMQNDGRFLLEIIRS